MDIVKKIRDIRGLTKYGMAKELDVYTSSIYMYEGSARSMRLDILCRLRKISGLTWKQFGSMLDQEFSK